MSEIDIRAHLLENVLGWWLRNAPDEEHGGVYTCWDNRGLQRVSTDKYTWSQGRWLWLLSAVVDAIRTGVLTETDVVTADRCLTLARTSAAFLRRAALLPDYSTAYVTDRTGTPREPEPGSGLSTSIFADCFVALGFAGLARVDSDAELGELAECILESVLARIDAGTARTEPLPVHPAFRSFAVPMILVGTASEIHRATKSDRSAQITVDAATTLARDFRVGNDMIELPTREAGYDDTLLARHRAPGHVLECLWFLVHAARHVPAVTPIFETDGDSWLVPAAHRSLAIGWDDRDGGLFRWVDTDGGEPRGRLLDDRYEGLVVDTWDTKLWWPHSEALYTTALLADRYRDAELARWHDRIAEYTFTTFPDKSGREWIQIRDRTGRPYDRTVALPVKDPFHIARALLYLTELRARGKTNQQRG